MSSDENRSVWSARAILFVIIAACGAVGLAVACDDTGPSPIGDHPDDSGPPDEGTPAADGGDEGGEGGDTDAEPTEGGDDDGGGDAGEDTGTIQDAKADG